jgi:hypothetical protein
MTTALSLGRLRELDAMGFMRHAHYDPLDYMLALERAGFERVGIEYFTDDKTSLQYQVIAILLTNRNKLNCRSYKRIDRADGTMTTLI